MEQKWDCFTSGHIVAPAYIALNVPVDWHGRVGAEVYVMFDYVRLLCDLLRNVLLGIYCVRR